MMGSLLSKDQILAADRKKFVDVPVKEWGGTVRLQELSASDRDLWESEQITMLADGSGAKFNPKHARARLIVRSLVDEQGRRLFSDDEVASVGSLSASTAQKLFNHARKLNAITNDDMKELEGNSDAAPSAGGSSTSASASV
ncbi:phage tail assembly chaperone [Luteibacter sp. PPL201]|uniref:Phage tail assembly chaperone n=1 Tax=Luteibacter sahnii TaxID=3021977 RepID=A0ABT6B854_9GAMM